MEKSKEFSKEEMEKVYEVDEAILNDFKDDCIKHFFVIYPTYLHRLLPFKTYEQAMLWLRQVDNKTYPLDISKK